LEDTRGSLVTNWLGKLIGGVLGFGMGGGVGALIGVVLGHQYDVGIGESLRRRRPLSVDDEEESLATHEVFFKACFSIMGHMAKSDGRVSEAEIRVARSVMHKMKLTPEQVKEAIKLFNLGKSLTFPLDEVTKGFRDDCGDRHDVFRSLMEVQMQVALADGRMHSTVRQTLWRVCLLLDISRVELAQIEAVVRAQNAFSRRRQDRLYKVDTVQGAYRVLGVNEQATDKEIKTAYRRLMNQHHPDKLVARDLPESAMNVAKEKTREIRSAYDTVKEARGMR